MITLGIRTTFGTFVSSSVAPPVRVADPFLPAGHLPTLRDFVDRHGSGSTQMPPCTGANAAASEEKP
jgi:hypothetical protein